MTRLAVPEPEWLITEPFWDAFGVEVRQDEAPDDGGTAMATFHQDGTRWWVVTLPWRDPPPDIPAENYSPSLMSLSPNGRYCAALVLERVGASLLTWREGVLVGRCSLPALPHKDDYSTTVLDSGRVFVQQDYIPPTSPPFAMWLVEGNRLLARGVVTGIQPSVSYDATFSDDGAVLYCQAEDLGYFYRVTVAAGRLVFTPVYTVQIPDLKNNPRLLASDCLLTGDNGVYNDKGRLLFPVPPGQWHTDAGSMDAVLLEPMSAFSGGHDNSRHLCVFFPRTGAYWTVPDLPQPHKCQGRSPDGRFVLVDEQPPSVVSLRSPVMQRLMQAVPWLAQRYQARSGKGSPARLVVYERPGRRRSILRTFTVPDGSHISPPAGQPYFAAKDPRVQSADDVYFLADLQQNASPDNNASQGLYLFHYSTHGRPLPNPPLCVTTW